MIIRCEACRGTGRLKIVGDPPLVTCPACKGKGSVHDARARDETKAKIEVLRLLFPKR